MDMSSVHATTHVMDMYVRATIHVTHTLHVHVMLHAINIQRVLATILATVIHVPVTILVINKVVDVVVTELNFR